MTGYIKVALLLWLALSLTACTPNTPQVVTPEGMPDIGIPVEEFNKDIRLSTPKPWNTFETKGMIILLLQPISKQLISFDENDTRTFLYDNGKWIELKNIANVIYAEGTSSIKILDSTQDFAIGNPSVQVDLPNPNQPALLRIFAIGYIYENGVKTDKKVASYVDINLKP